MFCIILTSCFEITEKVNHTSNGSGEYDLIINFSNSWMKTRAAIMLGEVDGEKIPNEESITDQLNDFKLEASKIKGITNVSVSKDFTSYIFKLHFKYDSIQSLNNVLNLLDRGNTIEKHFLSNDLQFQRNASYPFPPKLKDKKNKKNDLEKAKITAIYTFDKKVQLTSNLNSKLSKSKYRVFLQDNAWRVIQNNELMNNSILLMP